MKWILKSNFYNCLQEAVVEQFDGPLLSGLSVVIRHHACRSPKRTNTLSQQPEICSQLPPVVLLEPLKSTDFKESHFQNRKVNGRGTWLPLKIMSFSKPCRLPGLQIQSSRSTATPKAHRKIFSEHKERNHVLAAVS